ncbi:MAG TPA: ATP-binding protein [Chitinophagales bacterium]|nr:ATP-binding protein [Chitinophagales bacterium]
MADKEDIITATQQNLDEQLSRYDVLITNRQQVSEQQISYMLQLALDLFDEEAATRAYILLCNYQLNFTLDHIKALDYGKLALEQSEDLPDFYWRIKALYTTATSYHMLRDYPNELSLLQQAMKLLESSRCQSIDYYPLHHMVNYALGIMYMQMGLHTIAMPYIDEALRYCEGINDRQILFKTKLTRANLRMYKREYETSLAGYMDLYDAYGDQAGTEQWAILNNYISIIHLQRERYQESEKYIREAVEIRERIGDELRTNYSHFTLCKLLYTTGRIEEGDKYFAMVQKVIDKYPYIFDRQVKNDIYYELYAAKKDYEKAYHHFKELDISFVNNDILEKTIGSIFDAEKDKQQQAKEDTIHFRRLNDEMEHQAQELQKKNKDLNNYARTASHDLREPLRMVSTYMSILEAKLKDKLTDDEKQFLRFAVDGSKRMDEMVTRILNSAKGSQTVMKPVDLNKILEQLKLNLTRLITEKNAEISYDHLPIVLADDIEMLQVFQNLVTNAIKYNKSERPSIHITASSKGHFAHVLVTDNGVGIPEEAREKVFEMFSRVENASGEDGTGIGLSTVKSIIEKMKGKIWIEGNEPTGSVFNMLLPRMMN